MRLRSHAETLIVRHVKVKGDASPYDGNLIYWSTRMGEHPEVSTRVATLLKAQKGKCTHCQLYFREEDVLEVDHKIPRSKGGKDEYKNLQILYKHCHDKNSRRWFGCEVRLTKCQFIEEPDEVKVSRPVLKTNGVGDNLVEFTKIIAITPKI
ncbi:HNH endonuclease [Nostoc sp.]|uniref:HNH endonuclease n=1 Tax=Nostoc sp. TaxID=1180 RepID=UPI002FFB9A73